MDEFAVWEGVMWPLKAEGVSDLFQVWEGEKSRHSSFPSLPCVGGRDVGAYAPPQIGGDPTVNLTPRETLRKIEWNLNKFIVASQDCCHKVLNLVLFKKENTIT